MTTLDPSLLNQLNPQQLQNPQMTNAGRYVPPTFTFQRDNINGGQPQMRWDNSMQSFFLPQQTNNPFTQPYGNSQQAMFGRFGGMFGAGANGPGGQRGANPTVPQFRDRQLPGNREGRLSPYQQLAMQGRNGMDMNQMFDPRIMALFGGNGFGALKPTGPGPGYGAQPNTDGNKPYQVPGGYAGGGG